MTDCFHKPKSLLRWAEEAIGEVEAECMAFICEKNFPLRRERNLQLGETVFKIVQVADVPDVIERRATEALNNLRNAFDQALFSACAAIGKPVKDAHFPWATDPTDLKKWKLIGKDVARPKIPEELHDVISAQEPYKTGNAYVGGNDLIREMATLANRKHTIGLDVGARSSQFEFTGTLTQLDPNGRFQTMGGIWDSAKKEMILSVYRGKGPFYGPQQYRVSFHVLFDAPPPINRVPAVDALRAFLQKARDTVKALETRAIEIIG